MTIIIYFFAVRGGMILYGIISYYILSLKFLYKSL